MEFSERDHKLRQVMKLAHVSSADIQKSDSTCPNSHSMKITSSRRERKINKNDLKGSQSQNHLNYNKKVKMS